MPTTFYQILFIFYLPMNDSIRYLSIALQTIKLLQTELIKHLQKASSLALLQFKKSFQHHLNKVRNVELQKSIESDKISLCLSEMNDFLEKTVRMRKTSHSERFNCRGNLTTQGTQRMGLSGRAFYQRHSHQLGPGGLSQIQEITRSFKIKQSAQMATGMKWRISAPIQTQIETIKEPHKRHSIDTSSIEMLNQTIPEMQNRIKLLSFNRNTLDLSKQSPRNLQSRNHKLKRFIPRLI